MPSALLKWDANTELNLVGYKVYRGLGAATQAFLTSVGKVTTYTDTTLPNVSQNAAYSLTAFNSGGIESPHSVTVIKTVEVITMPSALLNWTKNTEPDMASYRVFRGFNGSAKTMLATVSHPTTTYTDTALTQDGTYAYDLTAVDSAGNESVTHSVTASITVNTNPPQPPSGLTAVLA